MNKTLVLGAIALTVFAASTAHADDRGRRDAPRYERNHNVGRDYGYSDRGHRHADWVAPVVGGLILGTILSEASRPPPVVMTPPPVVVLTPEQIGYQRGLEARLRQEEIERERAAYQCGLTGNC